MSEIMAAYWAAPPMARTMATAVLATSVSVYFGLLPYDWIYFTEDRLFKLLPEIWRLPTSFFLSSPQMGIVLDPYFLFQYLTQLETGNPRFPRKEDVLWYMITVGSMIVVLNRFFTGQAFFLQGLIIALCYSVTQDQSGAKASFFFFTVPAQLMPYCMLLMSVLMSPGLVPLQITGIVAAHLYDFLARIYPEFGGGPNLLQTPAFLSRLVDTPRMIQRDYGTAIRPPPSNPAAGSSIGASTGSVLPDSWRTRGTGHRLGGE